MKKMFETIFVLGLVLTGIVCVVACSDKLDVQQVYEFDMATLPVQNKIVIGEEAEIRCELVRGGTYVETKYFIRMARGSYAWKTGRFFSRMTSIRWKGKHSVCIINL